VGNFFNLICQPANLSFTLPQNCPQDSVNRQQFKSFYCMLKEIQVSGNKDTRSGFGDGILEAARKNPNIVALTADLAGSLKLNGFIKEFPERFIQCGIAEANMMGIAAGLTIGVRTSRSSGERPVTHVRYVSR
jgi:deoxyxylulose-5-phosphate synthase